MDIRKESAQTMIHVQQKPNFFVIGAAKAGTSSLWNYLNQHPEIFMSPKKEPGFFAPEWPGNPSEEKYLSLFKGAHPAHRRVGEASTMYLSCPGTAQRIQEYSKKHGVENLKFIAMLRNPLDRAYSLYNWQVQEGYEYASTFEKALEYEEARKEMDFPNSKLTGGYKYNYLYYHSGLYSSQLQEYFDLFGKENVMVLIFEEFIQTPADTLKEIFAFMGLEEKDYQPDLTIQNPSYDIYSPRLQFMLRRLNQTLVESPPMRWFIRSKKYRDFLISLGLKKNQKPPKLSTEVRQKLLQKNMAEIRRLETLLGKDLSIWMNPK